MQYCFVRPHEGVLHEVLDHRSLIIRHLICHVLPSLHLLPAQAFLGLFQLPSRNRSQIRFRSPAFRFTAINARLKLSRHSYLGQQNVISFLHSVLRADGLLAVSLIQESYGTALAEQLLRELWVMSESRQVRLRAPKLYDSLPTDLKLPSFSQSPNDLPKVPLMTSFTYDTPLKPHFK
uniref:Uncharacterized protein n=1 Tax=Panagrellus redivivus TaxID=6233 RepID=A0A7E4WC19_PANRE